MAASVPLLAFNDVYRVQQRYVPQPGCPDPPAAFPADAEIKVGQFAQLVYDLRATWPARKPGTAAGGSDDDGRDGLFLFAGDVFSPSVESSVTRGSHMVSLSARRAYRCARRLCSSYGVLGLACTLRVVCTVLGAERDVLRYGATWYVEVSSVQYDAVTNPRSPS